MATYADAMAAGTPSTQVPDRPTFAAGPVTGVGTAVPGQRGWPDQDGERRGVDVWGAPAAPVAPQRRTLLWWGVTATAIVAVGLAVVLVVLLNGHLGDGRGLLSRDEAGPPDTRPPLAKLCPPPTAGAVAPSAPALPPPTGRRTTDAEAGISYRSYGDPWQKWPFLWTAGTLRVPYKIGQYIQTEDYGGGYYASILSAAVPAAVNDSFVLDLECTGRQVAADVRAEYYPQPNQMDLLRDERTTLGGRPAWVTKFRMHFDEPGLTAKDELAAVALIDVGRPTAAVLYVSIPGTHSQFDWIVDDVLASVRPT
jgi:hypothetical protein